jgi:hypothetical protein
MLQRLASPALGFVTALAVSLSAAPVLAQASRLGPSFGLQTNTPALFPDAAYDPVNNVYLVVAGNSTIQGQYVSADGAPLGNQFRIDGLPAYAQTARVAYSPHSGGFLVTWFRSTSDGRALVAGRMVSLQHGALTPEFAISGVGALWTMGAAVAYSTATQEFLVAWALDGFANIRGQRVNNQGQLIGGPIHINSDAAGQRDPSVGYNPATNEFLVAYGGWDSTPFIRAQRINAATGEHVGGQVELSRAGGTWLPQVSFNSATQQFLVAWFQVGGTSGFLARLVNGDGSFGSHIIPLLPSGSVDALGLANNGSSGTFLLVTHGTDSGENRALQIRADGTPEVPFLATASGGINYNPRVTANGGRSEWLLVASRNHQQIIGQRIVSGTQQTGPPPPPPPSPPPPSSSASIDLSAGGAPNGSWFFAEGATGSGLGFNTYYLLSNENGNPLNVRAYFAKEDGFAVEKHFNVPAYSRSTVRLGDHVGEGSYAAVFQSTTPGQQVFVERSMYGGSTLEFGTASEGCDTPAHTWYFAEGFVLPNFFDNFFLVFNPSNTTAADVSLWFFRQNNQPPIERKFNIPPKGRVTFHANSVPELQHQPFSTRVDAFNVPVVAERSMYWGRPWRGGTNSPGAKAPSSVWYFAEGAAAPRFDTFYTILNTHHVHPVTVDVSYYGHGGLLRTTTHAVPPNSRETIYLTSMVGLAGPVGAELRVREAGLGIVAERSTYWGLGWIEGANAMGAPAAARKWHLAEGTTQGSFETFTLIANVEPFPVRVNVWMTPASGGLRHQAFDIPAKGRLTLYMNDRVLFPFLQNESFSTTVEVDGAGSVVAEHAIYWARVPGNYWRGGSVSMGIPR